MSMERPEHELLRLSVRIRFEPERAAQVIDLLERQLDWRYVLELSHHHHVLPLLNECLGVVGPGAVPAAALKLLAQRVLVIYARNRQLARELVRLHRAAHTAGIPMLSF